jgi:phosphate transport system substrate-binding protein
VIVSHTKRFGVLALATLFAVGACSGSGSSADPSGGAPSEAASADGTAAPSAAAVDGTVTVDGSSTVFPISEAVAEEFKAAQPGVDVTVAESGTGGGFKKFCAGETDINDASRPIKEADDAEGKACQSNGVTWAQLQVGIDGLTIVVNPQNTWVTCLTLDQLKTIYGPDSPENLSWKDVDPSFPDQPVVRYMPGADSGTFDYFTEAVNGEVDSSTAFATQSEDDNVLVTGVAGDQNAISYFGYAYYAENTDKLKAVEIDGGKGCVAPTDETIGDNTYAPLSRPLFIYPNTATAADDAALHAFVDFYLANAATLSAEVGYVAVPADVAAKQVADWTAAVPK